MGAMGPTHGRQKKRLPNGAFFNIFLKFVGAPSLSAEFFFSFFSLKSEIILLMNRPLDSIRFVADKIDFCFK